MSWIALILVGFGLADLAHSALRRSYLPELIGAAGVVIAGLLGGLTDARDLLAILIIAVLTLCWGRAVTRGFGDDRPALPLTVAGVTLVAVVLLAPLAHPASGPLQHWLDHAPLPILGGVDADRFLLILGGALVQMSTGNVVVRLVLAATHTIRPTAQDAKSEPEQELKGGRLLGPMERLVIFGLGLAGHLTAASLVIAAKGLLRFPELQSRRDQERIHLLTEYFLVGSFASWLIALGALVLGAR